MTTRHLAEVLFLKHALHFSDFIHSMDSLPSCWPNKNYWPVTIEYRKLYHEQKKSRNSHLLIRLMSIFRHCHWLTLLILTCFNIFRILLLKLSTCRQLYMALKGHPSPNLHALQLFVLLCVAQKKEQRIVKPLMPGWYVHSRRIRNPQFDMVVL